MISAREVSFTMKNKILVNRVSIQAAAGEFVVIMGANGAGKSTLLRLMAGSLRPSTGNIQFSGQPLASYSVEGLARKRAVLSQNYHIEFPMTVREMVMIGRYPYFNQEPHAQDETIVDEMLEAMELSQLAARNYQTLSGGEAQKVQMSRVLAQIGHPTKDNSKLLLLDEPISHLDIKYQHQLLRQAKSLCQQHVAVIAVLHDVNLALKYADRIYFMKAGAVIEELHQPAAISAVLLKRVFDVEATIIKHGQENFVVY
jgi:iron complex transport system ATP-binding protein